MKLRDAYGKDEKPTKVKWPTVDVAEDPAVTIAKKRKKKNAAQRHSY